MPSVTRTVGFRVFAITHGMKLSCPRRFPPWVFAFSPLPTVQNRCQARRPYRGFSCFCRYPRYTAGHAYRGFSRFACYPRYEIELSPPIPTVGFCIFSVTHGRKSLSGTSTVPWVFAFSPLPTVCRRSHLPWVFALSPLPTVRNRCQARRPYRWFLRFRHYPRYEIGLSMPIPTVGFCIFAVTHGRKSLSGPLTVPWVFAFSPLPTVPRHSHLPWVFAFSPLPTVLRQSHLP